MDKAVDMEQYHKESEEFNRRLYHYISQKEWLKRRYEDAIENVEDKVTEKIYEKMFNA